MSINLNDSTPAAPAGSANGIWQKDTSGNVSVHLPDTTNAANITSGLLALARGGTAADLSATGGAHQFLKQSSSGAAVTVGALVAADLPTQPFLFGAFLPGVPTSNYVLPFLMPGDIGPSYPANFANSTGKCGTNPTATVTITVTDNGSTIGTISVSTGGVATFATSGGASGTVAASHEVQVVFPASPDATFADFRFTMRWSR